MTNKEFEQCDDDLDYVNEDLLHNNYDVTEDRISMLKYIKTNYPKIFWEAYKEL